MSTPAEPSIIEKLIKEYKHFIKYELEHELDKLEWIAKLQVLNQKGILDPNKSILGKATKVGRFTVEDVIFNPKDAPTLSSESLAKELDSLNTNLNEKFNNYVKSIQLEYNKNYSQISENDRQKIYKFLTKNLPLHRKLIGEDCVRIYNSVQELFHKQNITEQEKEDIINKAQERMIAPITETTEPESNKQNLPAAPPKTITYIPSGKRSSKSKPKRD